jgi:hypothetical protein
VLSVGWWGADRLWHRGRIDHVGASKDGVVYAANSVRLRPGPDLRSHDDYVGTAYTSLAAFVHVYGNHHVRLLRARYEVSGAPVKVRPLLQWVPVGHDAVGFSRGVIQRDCPPCRFVYSISDVDLTSRDNGGWYFLTELAPKATGTARLSMIDLDVSIDGGKRLLHVSLPQDIILEVRHHGLDRAGGAHPGVDTGWRGAPTVTPAAG